jgi:hypothetical protein
MPAEPFRPSRHGFAFPNTFEVPSSPFGFGAPVAASFGLCAGMAWAALDRYLAGRALETDTDPPRAGNPLYAELLRRHANALGRANLARLTRWQQLPDAGRPGAPGLRERSRREWRTLRRRLDAGEPVLLVLILAAGPYANPTTNHMVLAYGYDLDRRAGRVALRVYDPNRPGNEGVRMVFRLGVRSTPLEGRLAVETRVRGFYVVAYDRPWPAGLVTSPVTAADGRTVPFDPAKPPAAAYGGGASHLFGVQRDGRALHAERDARGRWRAELMAARRGDAGAVKLAAVPTPLGARPWCLGVAEDGELMEFRRHPIVGWRVRPVQKGGAAGRLRVDGRPVRPDTASARETRFYAVAGGRLVAARRGWRGWILDRPAGPSLEGAPAGRVTRLNAEHVFARSADGELIHFRRQRGAGWTSEHVTAAVGGRQRFGIDDDPVCLPTEAGTLGVVARNAAGDVLLFRWSRRRGWRARNVSADLRSAGEPVPALASSLTATLDAAGTVHIAARATDGGLLHFWSHDDGEVGIDEVVMTRAAIGDVFRIDGAPRIAAATGGWLHVLARRGGELLLFRWAPGADWTVESISAENATSSSVEPSWLDSRDGCHIVHAGAAGGVRYFRLGTPRSEGFAAAAGRAFGIVGAALGSLLALPIGAFYAVLGVLGGVAAGKDVPRAARVSHAASRKAPAEKRAARPEPVVAQPDERAAAARAGTTVPAAREREARKAPAAVASAAATPPAGASAPSGGAADVSAGAVHSATFAVQNDPAAATADGGVGDAGMIDGLFHGGLMWPATESDTAATPASAAAAETALPAETGPPRESAAGPAAALPPLADEWGSPPERAAAMPAAQHTFDEVLTAAELALPSGVESPAEPVGDPVLETVQDASSKTASEPPKKVVVDSPPGAEAARRPGKAARPVPKAAEAVEAKPDAGPSGKASPASRPQAKDSARMPELDVRPAATPRRPAAEQARPPAVRERSAVLPKIAASAEKAPVEAAHSTAGSPAAASPTAGSNGAAASKGAVSPANGAVSPANGGEPAKGAARPKLNPALEGLPFLDDETPPRAAEPNATPPRAAEPKATPPAVSPKERRRRDVDAMQRIMSLAEEYSTRLEPGDTPTSALDR